MEVLLTHLKASMRNSLEYIPEEYVRLQKMDFFSFLGTDKLISKVVILIYTPRISIGIQVVLYFLLLL